MNAKMNKSEKFWDRQSDKFDELNTNFEPTNIKTLENTKKYLNGNETVLDYGCATGIQAIEIAGYVKEVHGIDISSKMIDSAKRKAAGHKIKNVNFAQATIFEEKFKRESFDVILAFNILHLAGDTQKVMQRLNDLLKPGGLIISVTACLGEKRTFKSFLLFLMIFLLSKTGMLPNMRFFKVSELEDSITHGNFQIVETGIFKDSPMIYFIAAKKTGRTL
jgi:2-polyprenyl-3-methyl-5-hydroxy-6-metoxy-1,4-benzoquinol methylase